MFRQFQVGSCRPKPAKALDFHIGRLTANPKPTDNKNVTIRISSRAGTTLVELMVCLVFIGLCSAAMVNAIGAASRQASIAEEKLLALATAKTELAKAQVNARDNAIVVGTTTTYPSDTGIRYPVTVRTVISPVGTYADLYLVSTLVSWESNTGREHSGKVELQTYVVSNDK